MAFSIVVTGDASNRSTMPFEDEEVIIQDLLAEFAASLRDAGFYVGVCTHNGEPVEADEE